MHINFYHWHSRVALILKSDSAVLEPRWNAAVKFAKKPSAADLRSLLRLVLFPGAEPEFAKRFTEGLVKAEPTFPPNDNFELLRVMASAAAYSLLETSSNAADVLAIGLQAADFPKNRVEPVCQEVMTRAAEYLSTESERVRPKIYAGTLAEFEKKLEANFVEIKRTAEANNFQEGGKAIEAVGRGMLAAVKESHKQLGEVIGRMAEESQFLWWLIGHRSPAFNAGRQQLTPQVYAFPAAAEAAERVTVMPPPASVESLLSEVLAQCAEGGQAGVSLMELTNAADTEWIKRTVTAPACPELTPMTALLSSRLSGGKPDADLLKRLGISAKLKYSPTDAARQYFRELMLVKAIAAVD